MAIFQYNNSKPIIAMHVTGTHTHRYLVDKHHFPVKNKSTELHRVHTTLSLQKVITFYDYFSKKNITFFMTSAIFLCR